MTEPADSLPLPSRRHMPGSNERHAEDAFDAVKALCPAMTSDSGAADNVTWRYGLRLIDEGFYWESHEVLETVWICAPPNSRERALVQAVIHIANGALKREMAKPAAAFRLAGLARECSGRAFGGKSGSVMGLDADAVAEMCDGLSAGKPLPLVYKKYAL